MKITIKDIAKECGVSVATVSLALSDKPSRVAEKTKKLVREVAEKYNYQPNNAAVSLVSKKSKLIGIVFNDLRNSHISSLFMEINSELEKRGFSMVCHIVDDSDNDINVLHRIAGENISGLIWAKSYALDQEAFDVLDINVQRLGIPVLTMDDYDFHCAGVNVLYDYYEGGYLATKHLIELGHEKIGCLTGIRSFNVTEARYKGYRKALEEYGLPYDLELVYEGDYTMESGYQALSYLKGKGVTAIFSMNDEMAFGIYRAARAYGMSIPNDVSVVGFDDVPFSDVLEVPLTTIKVPVNQMGTYIGNTLAEYVGKGGAKKRKSIVYKPQLLIRGSTKKKED